MYINEIQAGNIKHIYINDIKVGHKILIYDYSKKESKEKFQEIKI